MLWILSLTTMDPSSLIDFATSHRSYTLFTVGLVFFICVEVFRRRRIHKLANPRSLPYPPGPKPLPIVGNIFDVALDNQASAYQVLAKQYGESTFY